MEGVEADPPVHGGVGEGDAVPVVGQEAGLQLGAVAAVQLEELAAQLERGGADVDRDGAAAEAVQAGGEPAAPGPEVEDRVPEAEGQLREGEAQTVEHSPGVGHARARLVPDVATARGRA